MKHYYLLGSLPLMALVSMTACVDNKYDLSDIDTTTEIKVKDLTLPVNIDDIKLGDIISVEEDSEFNEIEIGGQKVYAVNKSGTFASDDIEIPGFSAPAPQVEGITIGFGSTAARKTRAFSMEFDLQQPETTSVSYSAENIDPAIVSVEALTTNPFEISVKFDASSVASLATLELKDLTITLPKGLEIVNFIPANLSYTDGLLTIPSLKLDNNGKGEIKLEVAGIKDMAANGYAIRNHSLSINEDVTVSEAKLAVELKENATPGSVTKVEVGISFSFSDLVAKTFTGEVQYSVNGINIDPVEINDLPDFLAGNETDIVLANPQIYLNLNNPVGEYNLAYQTGLNIIPVRNGVDGAILTLDNNDKIVVNNGNYPTNLYLSPSEVNDVRPGFNDPAPKHYGFASLSDAIAGNGIPQQLKIELVNPEIPTQQVTGFRLGETLNGVEGKWEFLAPLAFKKGTASKITYTADGWNSEDVDAITITQLTISTTVSNTLPVDLSLSGYPIDIAGNRIPGTQLEPQTIKAGADGQEVVLQVTGNITKLDGFTFEIGIGAGSEEALSPNQTIILKDIRAKVSGSYIKEL
ncbi:MAG: hypothetical protein K2J63_02355 [Muribaculaceae bacterium]|nr:hypothetical protein [Muribaculaceae bacterium]